MYSINSVNIMALLPNPTYLTPFFTKHVSLNDLDCGVGLSGDTRIFWKSTMVTCWKLTEE
jgi:hypothetical protein